MNQTRMTSPNLSMKDATTNQAPQNAAVGEQKGAVEGNLMTLVEAAVASLTDLKTGESQGASSAKKKTVKNDPALVKDKIEHRMASQGEVQAHNGTMQGQPTKKETMRMSPLATAAKTPVVHLSSLSSRKSVKHIRPNIASSSFPAQLWNVLNREENSESIAWMPTGKSFAIINHRKFTEELIPVFFGNTKTTLASFIAKLGRWGFERASVGASRNTNLDIFYHPFFQRNKPELLCGVKCLVAQSPTLAAAVSGHHRSQPVPPPHLLNHHRLNLNLTAARQAMVREWQPVVVRPSLAQTRVALAAAGAPILSVPRNPARLQAPQAVVMTPYGGAAVHGRGLAAAAATPRNPQQEQILLQRRLQLQRQQEEQRILSAQRAQLAAANPRMHGSMVHPSYPSALAAANATALVARNRQMMASTPASSLPLQLKQQAVLAPAPAMASIRGQAVLVPTGALSPRVLGADPRLQAVHGMPPHQLHQIRQNPGHLLHPGLQHQQPQLMVANRARPPLPVATSHYIATTAPNVTLARY